MEDSLQALDAIKPLYWLPTDPVVEEVLIPGFRNSIRVDCMFGFFASSALTLLAPGLATFINEKHGKLNLIISPVISDDDRVAIEEGVNATRSTVIVMTKILHNFIITENQLEQHALKCLTWLLQAKRLEIKIALTKRGGFFHPKVWLFRDDGNTLAVHGSGNLTFSGIQKNIEQIGIAKSWKDLEQNATTQKLDAQFNNLWQDKDEDCTVIPAPQAIKDKLLQTYNSATPPTESELLALYKRAHTPRPELPPPPTEPIESPSRKAFTIPSHLRFEEGPFAHQGEAVKAWCDKGYKGILEMATGSGKTITAMICAYRLYKQHKPLLIIVSAPYVPLIQQWCDEVSEFGLQPINLTEASGAKGRAEALNRIKRAFRVRTRDVEAIVVSHRTLCSHEFKDEIKKIKCATLLIGDEVHNLGSLGFISNPPDFIDYRLGLSATPERQYDEEGTEALLAFFGPVVFEFGLEKAIGNCLVEYDYYIHTVELTQQEVDDWHEFTEKIKASAWHQKDKKPDEHMTRLLIKRRAILENAENKIPKLTRILEAENLKTLCYTLIYASDKNPEQLKQINQLLNTLKINFHQLTEKETSNRPQTRQIISSFQDKALRVLTAKKVLDEGVNIPQIEKAFILASTTVERQWIQRRGRLLRTCKETRKTHSEIHDFIALPPQLRSLDSDVRAMVASELVRVREFAKLARNAGRDDGPLREIMKLTEIIAS